MKVYKKIITHINIRVLLIILISILSVGWITQTYFSHDDFFLFYALQFPGDTQSIFQAPDSSGYRALKYIFYPQFYFFGYSHLGYYIFAILSFIVVVLMFYFFLKNLLPNEKKIPFIAALLFASGYIGIEAFSWNIYSGPNATFFLFLTFFTLLLTYWFYQYSSKKYLILSAIGFIGLGYFFQFRSYLILGWYPLFIISLMIRDGFKKSKLWFYSFSILLISINIFIFQMSNNYYSGRIGRVDLNQFLDIFLKNLGYLVLPENLINNLPLVYIGWILLLVFIIVPIIFYITGNPWTYLIFFFSLSTISALILIMLATSFIGHAPSVWSSTHRFYFVILPFLAGFLSILISSYKSKLAFFLKTTFIILWILTHVVLSYKSIIDMYIMNNSHIEYFYKTIKSYLPKIEKNSVLLITEGNPRPYSPFVSGSFVNGMIGPAGFYGLKLDEFKLTQDTQEALRILKDHNLSEQNLYVFNYRSKDMFDQTNEARQILKNGMRINLGEKLEGRKIELKGLSLPASVTPYINVQMKVITDLVNLQSLQKSDQVKIINPEKYFPLLFMQHANLNQMKVYSESKPLSEEHNINNVVDGLYDTTWIPSEWGSDGVSLVVDLGKIKSVNRIVWSSARMGIWYVRLPSEYNLKVSSDGINYKEIKSVINAPILKTGQFNVEDFSQQNIRYIKLTIKKTYGGFTPAVDDIEAFNNFTDSIDFSEYFILKQNPEIYFPNREIAERYLTEILRSSINIEVAWLVDENNGYPSGQVKKINLKTGNFTEKYNILLPVVGRNIKSIKIQPSNFPAIIYISKIEIQYPSLKELFQNNSLD